MRDIMVCSYCKKEFKKVTKANTCSLKCRLMDSIIISENGCWEWQKCLVRGYGKLRFGNKHMFTHRISYEIFKGKIPENMFICHNCPNGDNPKCCNPDHLWIGSLKENSADAKIKGKYIGKGYTGRKSSEEVRRKISLNHADMKGEKSSLSKLKDKDVYAIKELLKTGMTLTAIGNIYGVSKSCINNIKTGKRWGHL